jgi:hypothetical protein
MKLALALPFALLPLVLAPPPAHRELEPNDDAAHATPLEVGRRFGGLLGVTPLGNGATVSGRIDPGDVDYYALRGRAGDVLTVSVGEPGRGELHDPVLAVFGPGDAAPYARNDDGGPRFLPRLAVPIDRAGTWTVAVGGFGDAALDGRGQRERFDYTLVATVSRPSARTAEHEGRRGNGDPAHPDLALLTAASLLFGEPSVVTGTLTRGDADYFLLAVPRHAVVSAAVFDDARGEYDDSVLQVLDWDGNVLARDDDSGPGFLSNLVLPADDEHPRVLLLALTGFDSDPADAHPHAESFPYRLVVSYGDP